MTPTPPLFGSRAKEYASFRPSYPPQVAEAIAGAAPALGRAADWGCGSGQMSVQLAGHFDHVVAADASPEQLAQARRHERVTYLAARAERAPLPDGCADAVVAAQAAHWFDLPAFYDEVRRISRPEAVVALVGYGLPRLRPEVDELIAELHDDILGPYWSAGRSHIVDGYSSLECPFPALPSPTLEMTASWTLRQFVGYLSTWSALARAEREGVKPFPDFVRRLGRAWGATDQVQIVRWPVWVRMARVA